MSGFDFIIGSKLLLFFFCLGQYHDICHNRRDKVGSMIKLNHKRFKQKINNTERHLGIVLIYMYNVQA